MMRAMATAISTPIRRILASAVGCIAGLFPLASRAAEPANPPRPNILFAIADDWSWPHAGIYGDSIVKTPTFDRIAREGVLFTNSYCAAATCTASRAAILTGQWPHRLESGANLWSILPAKFPVYPDLLEKEGYAIGHMGKGWAPGALGDRKRNPAGPNFKSFDDFLKTVPAGKPWCFWYGSHDPHRPYKEGQGKAGGINPATIKVPPFLPDVDEVRSDIADYYFAVQRFDRDTGAIVSRIEATGQLDNTLVVMTSDNGMPFPRAKANCYEYSNHMPLAIRWGAKVKPGQKVDALVSHLDFAPTFLQVAGVKPSQEMTGKSLLSLLATGQDEPRTVIFVERERHANVREGDKSYPMRGIRTGKYLFIHNFDPRLWPAGDPKMWKAVGPFGDIDGGPSKGYLLDHREDRAVADLFHLACEKRPAEELYDLEQDPFTMHNIADYPERAATLKQLRGQLQDWMKDTADPRATAGGNYDAFDKYPYTGR
jgi:N-sulfoglucosamine sulfohydrolase